MDGTVTSIEGTGSLFFWSDMPPKSLLGYFSVPHLNGAMFKDNAWDSNDLGVAPETAEV